MFVTGCSDELVVKMSEMGLGISLGWQLPLPTQAKATYHPPLPLSPPYYPPSQALVFSSHSSSLRYPIPSPNSFFSTPNPSPTLTPPVLSLQVNVATVWPVSDSTVSDLHAVVFSRLSRKLISFIEIIQPSTSSVSGLLIFHGGFH